MARQENSGRKSLQELDAPIGAVPVDGLIRSAPVVEAVRTLSSLYRDKTNILVLDTVQTALHRPGVLTPIIFSGPSGTGKTHLIQGVEGEARRLGRSVCLLNLTFSSTAKTQDAGVSDFLLVDGLHRLPAAHEDLRDLFFTIFEAHFEARRQIFLTTEIDPREIALPSRWQSRLYAGLVLELALPDDQDRLEFLLRKLGDFEMELPKERLVALNLPEGLSYRDLESVAAMIFLYSRNGWSEARLAEALHARFNVSEREAAKFLPVEDILRTVMKRFSVTREDILGKSRRTEHTLPRHIAMVLALRHTGLNKSSIARYFQRSDHSIVIHAEKKIDEAMRKDSALKHTYRRIARDLGVSTVEKR